MRAGKMKQEEGKKVNGIIKIEENEVEMKKS
jgi:hypothetical protein